jgi:uncharacterized protein (TIGR02452 family)
MYRAARVRYHQNPALAKQLVDTGDKEITHDDGNPFWAKWNALIQMRCREELKSEDERNMETLNDIIKQFDDEVKRFSAKRRVEIETLPGDAEYQAASSLTKAEVNLRSNSKMIHRFKYDAAWGESLTRQAPAFTRVSYQRSHQIVVENDEVVNAGCFKTEEDGREVQLEQSPPTERFTVPEYPIALESCRFGTTRVCVANIDTESAALLLPGSLALNFANAYTSGGGYRHGARAQEEDLCRLLPQLIHSLEACDYPIEPSEALVTRKLQAVRQPGTYQFCDSLGEVDIVTAAMPCGDAGRPGSETWNETVTLRMRAVLHAAKQGGYKDLVLGAWGCGAFGNPPSEVAALFQEQLVSPEFGGAFENIVFAVLDPAGDGNFHPFLLEIAKIQEPFVGRGDAEKDRPKPMSAAAWTAMLEDKAMMYMEKCIHFVPEDALKSIKKKVADQTEISGNEVQQLFEPEDMPDATIMVPVDMLAGTDFEDLGEALEKLDPKGTAEAILKAREYVEANNDGEAEKDRPKPLSLTAWKAMLEELDMPCMEGEEEESMEAEEDEEEPSSEEDEAEAAGRGEEIFFVSEDALLAYMEGEEGKEEEELIECKEKQIALEAQEERADADEPAAKKAKL